MALAIWKRLPVNRRDELLKAISRNSNRIGSATGLTGKTSAAQQQLNRRMQIIVINARPVLGTKDVVIDTDPSDAGSGVGANQTIAVDPGDAGGTLPFIGYGAPAVTKTYAANGNYTLVASDGANVEARGVRDIRV